MNWLTNIHTIGNQYVTRVILNFSVNVQRKTFLTEPVEKTFGNYFDLSNEPQTWIGSPTKYVRTVNYKYLTELVSSFTKRFGS